MAVQHCIDAIDKGFHTVTEKKDLGGVSLQRQGAALESWIPSRTPCAAFSKESRMKFASAAKVHRKSGGRRRCGTWTALPATSPY